MGLPGPQRVPRDAWVLHIGDSFVHAAFQQNLRPLFRTVGAEYVVDATNATYTTTWVRDPELEKWLNRRPSLVLVTLGANEVEMPDPTEHAGAIRALSRKIAAVAPSCVWITPPMWKKDTGILQVIHDQSAPCLFFDSDAVLGGLGPDERQRDRIHPNERGGARWARAFWGWLQDHRDTSHGPWALVPWEPRE
jgi:lysophospholipase L1-like esterase